MRATRSELIHLLHEAVRFLAVGGLATVVSFVGFNALVHGAFIGVAPMQREPIRAYVLVNLVGALVAYAGMRLWAFRHREVPDPLRALVRYLVLGTATMAIPVLCLTISRYLLGLEDVWSDNIAANVVGLGLSTAARFWLFRRYVFIDVGLPVAGASRA